MRDVFDGTEPTTRIGTPVPDEPSLAAIPPKYRVDGQLRELTNLPGDTYVFRLDSISPPVVGFVVVPNDIAASPAYIASPVTAPGRWVNQTALAAGGLPRLTCRLIADFPLVATFTGDILTSTATGAIPNIDSRAPAVGDKILMTDQSNPADNVLVVITNLGATGVHWTAQRSYDMDESSELVSGMSVYASDGAVYGTRSFTLTTIGPFTLGTTALAWRQGSATITLSLTITLTQLQAIGAAKTYPFTVGPVPAGARYRGSEVVLTPVDDSTHGTAVLNLGWTSGATALESAVDISAATSSGFPKAFSGASAYAGGSAIGGKTVTGTIVTGANMNTLTAGNVVVTLQYSVGG